jgi:hypothetical protein
MAMIRQTMGHIAGKTVQCKTDGVYRGYTRFGGRIRAAFWKVGKSVSSSEASLSVLPLLITTKVSVQREHIQRLETLAG